MIKRLILALLVGLLVAAPVAAGKPQSGLFLVDEHKIQPIGGLSTCYHEDWIHDRTWKGSLAPGESFSVMLRWCDLALDGRSPGTGGFLYSDAYRGGPLLLTATSPAGTVYPAYFRMDRQGRDLFWRCALRPLSLYAPGILTSGTWTVTLTNTGRDARDVAFSVDVHGAGSPSWIQGVCPPQDWTM